MAKSIFIEGTDGSGKSTQLILLKEYLESKHIPYITLREPGGSPYYEALRDLYIHSPHKHPPISDALISAAGRAANIAETKQALANGKWVITDRAYPSSYVYQAVQGVPLADIAAINNYALNGFDYDIRILLDVPTEVAAERVNGTGAKKDYWESQGKTFFETIRQKYLELAESNNYTVIDASSDIQSVHQKIIATLGI